MSKKQDSIPENLTKGGPDPASEFEIAPGKVNTSSWWKNMSELGAKYAEEENSIVKLAKEEDIWFCTIPFTQVYTEIDGRYQACCFGAPAEERIETTSLRDWMENSDYMNDLRKEMTTPGSDLKTVNHHCKRCRDDEARYGRSRRTNCMKLHTNDHVFWDDINRSVEMFRHTGFWEFEERICEIQLKVFGSQCNLDCHMCIHANSTTRVKAAKDGVWNDAVFGAWNTNRENYIKNVMKDRTKGVIEQVVELAPYVRSIKIIGGEPLIMKKQYELLDELIKSGDSKDIIIKYQTNLTKMQAGKHKFIDYIPHFRKVSMVASVDGIGEVNDYMRRKSKWEEIENNIDILQDFENVDVDFNGLVSFLSVMRFYEVIDYVKDSSKVDQLNWAMLEKPVHLRVNNLPQKIKDDLIEKYELWPDIQSALKLPADPGVDIQNVFDYLMKHDNYYKGTKWEMNLFEVFPELEEYYEERPIDEERTNLFKEWDKQKQESSYGDLI